MQHVDSFPSSPSDSGWHGGLYLRYAHDDGGTTLVQPWVRAPLKVQRPFYPEGPEICHSVLLHTAGGVVGSDRLSIQLQLQPQARALITTAAASKLYRTNGLQAQQAIQVEVAEGACLEWLPQETIVFDRAHYRQTMRIDLAPGATWLGWDITRFGRTAKGERFTSGEWRSHTEVWQAGTPLWVDRQWLPGSEELINSPHGLAGCGVVGSFAFLGQTVEPELVEKARQLWTGEGEVGVTRLRSGSASRESGLLCRYRGNSTSEVRHWFTAVWHLIRVSFLGQSACIPRVWGV